jgi:hypothetical protein
LQPLRVEAGIGERFPSVLPGHEGHEAVVERAPTGTFVYRCDCKQDGTGDATLADVHAALAYGEFELLTESARAIWHRLLLRKAGRLKPVRVDLPNLATDAGDDAQMVRRAFAIVMGLREHDHPGQPMMFSRRFVAAICGISEERARAGIRMLVETGVIRLTGRHRGAYLYMPGLQSEGAAQP